jgi:nicotinamide riboside kinase
MDRVFKREIMKIAFTGAQGTGKTTLLNELKQMFPYSPDSYMGAQYTFIDEITRNMLKHGLSINEKGTDVTQLLIMNSHLKNVLAGNVVMDRCALDGVVYTRYLHNRGQVSDWVMDYAERVFQMIISEYDYIFYLVPEFDLKDDGTRSTSIDFRNQIVDIFNTYILECEIPVIRLTGNLQQRINQIKEAVNE